jgi:fermentation-respiration switch protein FrsA (DUF1100 family)
MTTALVCAGFALLVLAALIAVAPRFRPALYTKMLFNGSFTGGTTSLAWEDVYFETASGDKLHGVYYRHPTSSVTLLLSHGNGGTIPGWAQFAEMFASADVSLFVYDYRGFAKSEGRSSLTSVGEDGLAAYDYLVGHLGAQRDKIISMGWSIGSIAACRIASERQCGALVLFGAFTSIATVAYEAISWLKWVVPRSLFLREGKSNLQVVRELNGSIPVLIVHASEDQLIRRSHADALLVAAGNNGELLELPGCTHNKINDGKPSFVDAVRRLVQKLS